MTLSFLEVALISTTYLAILFAIAYSTERGWVSDKVVSHPLTYIFSLGIFASAWAFYGVVDLAQDFGYGALAYYLGTGTLFLFASYALKPLVELARRFQVNSMADLLVFRYHSHSVGGMVTLVMLMAMAPLLTLQIQAVADTMDLFTRGNHEALNPTLSEFGLRQVLALIYCVAIALFATLFGSNREHHKGMVTVMAFESLIKVFGLLAVGFFVIYEVFGGMAGLDCWCLLPPLSPCRTSSI
jgi:Na+/proline symporter